MFKIFKDRLGWSSSQGEIWISPLGNGIAIQKTYKEKPIILYEPLEKTGDERPVILLDGSSASFKEGTSLLKLDEKDGELSFSLFSEDGKKVLAFSSSDIAFSQKGEEGGELSFSFIPENPSEKIFGMGQYQDGRLNIKGFKAELAQHNTQISIPFFISDKGYGFFWDNPAIGEADFLQDKTVFQAKLTDRFAIWLTVNRTPKENVRSFMAVAGKPEMMPDYGMGFWQSRLRYYKQEQIEQTVQGYQERKIPLSMIVCDFYHYPHLGDMRFDSEFFPDPKEMIKKVNETGAKFLVSFWPFLETKSENYQEMEAKGLLIKSSVPFKNSKTFGTTIFFDMANPKTMDYVWEKCQKNYVDYGITNFWLDEIEPHNNVEDPAFYSGIAGSHLKTGNLYPLLVEKGFYTKMKGAGIKDVVNLCRCAWAGSQRFGSLVWSGDVFSKFEALEKQIPAGINIGLAGISWWNTDIGGFTFGLVKSPKFRNLLIRWFEFGTFCPLMRLHGWRFPVKAPRRKDGSKVFYTGADNEVWSYGPKNYEIMVKYIFLREKMKPYLKKIYKEASLYGDPLIRGLFYEFPEDEIAYAIKDEYLFGSSLLVAPIIKAFSRQRKVYLPKGATWYSVLDHQIYQGGKTYLIKARLDQIPVFCKNGEEKDLFKNL